MLFGGVLSNIKCLEEVAEVKLDKINNYKPSHLFNLNNDGDDNNIGVNENNDDDKVAEIIFERQVVSSSKSSVLIQSVTGKLKQQRQIKLSKLEERRLIIRAIKLLRNLNLKLPKLATVRAKTIKLLFKLNGEWRQVNKTDNNSKQWPWRRRKKHQQTNRWQLEERHQ